ncbi:tyrosine-protein phosphatase non-receptor type 2 isoform X2 [Ursus maritimus]|uniref:protein-tyrosine-phosphatase n=1 Tax=Ursus maritimus TaxID=29073 RepID=A0A8M1F0J3_URSMA|nr:tyrosine-protein phosphatase non-receptor type 2 isoform X2 [Ursus maritimus]
MTFKSNENTALKKIKTKEKKRNGIARTKEVFPKDFLGPLHSRETRGTLSPPRGQSAHAQEAGHLAPNFPRQQPLGGPSAPPSLHLSALWTTPPPSAPPRRRPTLGGANRRADVRRSRYFPRGRPSEAWGRGRARSAHAPQRQRSPRIVRGLSLSAGAGSARACSLPPPCPPPSSGSLRSWMLRIAGSSYTWRLSEFMLLLRWYEGPTFKRLHYIQLDGPLFFQPVFPLSLDIQEIRNESHDYPHRVAKFPENRNRNRYRDVSPYDHSRVKLQNADNDYINASLVDIEEAQRSYILTQGPLPNTGCHFWLMVWQQNTKAVVMLNRVVEKESSGETRTISHFHYTTWPDFGVPESPASFLNFLFKVRESGSLNPEHGPAVIHCSAGIGRSGTFSLVDTCLVLMEKGDDINIKQLLLNMRKYRMGLIQTPDQLRFSYMTIIEGAKFIKGDSNIQKRWKELSKEDLCPAFDHSPTKIMTEKYNGNRIGLEEEKLTGDRYTGLSSKMQDTSEESSESVLRKRIREDRKANTAQKVQEMKQRLNETERKRKRPRLTDT